MFVRCSVTKLLLKAIELWFGCVLDLVWLSELFVAIKQELVALEVWRC